MMTGALGITIGVGIINGLLAVLMWYLLPVLIGWVALLGTGPRPVGSAFGRARRALLEGTHVVTIAVCLVVWSGPSLAMARVTRQPMREAAMAVSPSAASSPSPGRSSCRASTPTSSASRSTAGSSTSSIA